MKEIYIMLSQVGTLVSKSIKLYTKAKYNHASIGVDPSLRIFYSFARRVRYFPLIGGFITEAVNQGIFRSHPDAECAIYALTVADSIHGRVCEILETYKRDPKKYRYNLMALIGILINRPFSSDNKCTCAEFVAKVLQQSGIHSFRKPLCLIRPDELPDIPGLRLIYEGRMMMLGTRWAG